MSSNIQILGISGSLRKASLNTALLHHIAEMLPEHATLHIHSIGDLPLFNADLEGENNQAVDKFREAIRGADAVLIVSPEYNYSVPGVLKNAMDWGSRPAFKSAFSHKPVGVLGTSPSPVGTARGQAHIRQALVGMVAQIFPHKELAIGGAGDKFDDDLKLTHEATQKHLQDYLDHFCTWVQKQRK